jgi:hypothetical protein
MRGPVLPQALPGHQRGGRHDEPAARSLDEERRRSANVSKNDMRSWRFPYPPSGMATITKAMPIDMMSVPAKIGRAPTCRLHRKPITNRLGSPPPRWRSNEGESMLIGETTT